LWFSTSIRSNIDAETTAKIAAERDVPLSIVILILCVVRPVSYLFYHKLMFSIKIEHALKEWENGKKAHKVAFSEDSAKQRFGIQLPSSIKILINVHFSYAHHLGNWKRMSMKAPAWVKYWKNELMEKLLYVFFF
jgi:hypothetical protein